MREGWEIKKLGEITSFVGDGDWIESKDQSQEGIRLIQTGNIGEGEYKDKEERAKYISKDTFHRLHCTEIFAGDCLVSRLPDPIGRACILPKLDERTITAVDCSILRFKPNFLPQLFVYYSLSNQYQSYIKTNATGTTRKRISRKRLEQTPIPVPPIAGQVKIVYELDCLSKVIAKKRLQLVDLDKLSQSVFYDMFGDPLTNEKGWSIKRVLDFAEITDYVANGSFATLRDNVQYAETEDYAVLVRMVDYSNGFDRSKFVYVTKHSYDFLEKSRLFGGEIIMNNVGARLGVSFICPNLDKPMTLGPNSIVIKSLCNIFNQRMFSLPSSIDYIRSISGNTAMPKFNKTEFKKLVFIQPPLDLQKEFAQKIETIEKQKEQIKKSISETETLFNSRMDYWFN